MIQIKLVSVFENIPNNMKMLEFQSKSYIKMLGWSKYFSGFSIERAP